MNPLHQEIFPRVLKEPADLARRIKNTTNRCIECHRSCSAEAWTTGKSGKNVHLKRTCPVTVTASALVLTFCVGLAAHFFSGSSARPR